MAFRKKQARSAYNGFRVGRAYVSVPKNEKPKTDNCSSIHVLPNLETLF
jgi:hypothetical protein